MNLIYLAALLVSLAGMVILDRRYALFFARDRRRAAIVLTVGIVFFLVWDFAGIGLGIFFLGDSGLVSGVMLAPELPLEELVFLTLLCYVTMNAFGAATRLLERRTR